MIFENEMKIEFDGISENESFARIVVSAFIAILDPTIDEIADVKTAISEAVTNAIIHGYDACSGKVYIYGKIVNRSVYFEVEDFGRGINNIEEARRPLFTSRPDQDRSGMGFTVMEAFMDSVQVESKEGYGTKVLMKKNISPVPSTEDSFGAVADE
jgi:stage II sporulation protein AB (anti-sigma F factor)